MRVLVPVDSLEARGGVELSSLQVARELSRRGHQVDVVFREDGNLRSQWEQFATLRQTASFAWSRRHALPDSVRLARSLAGLRALKPDVIWLNRSEHLVWALAAEVLTGAGVVVHLRHPPTYRVGRLLRDRVAGFLAVSSSLRDAWIAAGVRPDTVRTVHNGIDPGDYPRAGRAQVTAARTDLGLPLEAFVVLYYGRLIPEKGLSTLVDAWPQVLAGAPQAHLLVVGGDAPPGPFEGLPRSLQVAARADVVPLLHAADVGVLPSVWPEPFGRVLVEAMAAGLPVVASAVGGIPEVLGEEFADNLVPAGDAPALARALLRAREQLLHDEDLAARCQAFATKRYPLTTTVDAVEDQLSAAARAGRGRLSGPAPLRQAQALPVGEVLFSVIVPTYQRRDVVLETVLALGRAQMPWPCEVIVVVDGSSDGTTEALAAITLPCELLVVEQANAGAAAARNAGAAVARGRYLMFLDDDMVADPALLVEHAKVLQEGADAVVGHIPLHPDSPRTLLTVGVERWARLRRERLMHSQGRLTVGDLLTGQLSVAALVFRQAMGFDADFTRHGSFGGEDTDFLHRLVSSGADVRFAAEAVSHQRYVVGPDQYLAQWRQAGQADAGLARKHPELTEQLRRQHGADSTRRRLLEAGALRAPALADKARELALSRARAGRADPVTRGLFSGVRDVEYWKGVRSAGGLLSPGARGRVLAYHGFAADGDASLASYSVLPDELDRQLTALRAQGWRFLSAQAGEAALVAGALPARSLVLTFDDAYADVVTAAAPILRRHGVTGILFVVSGQLGGWNAWDAGHGGARLELLGVEALARLVDEGWVLGAHSATHAHLTQLSGPDLAREVTEPLRHFADHGLPRPNLFAYPYGEHDWRVRAAVRRAGYRAAMGLVEARLLRGRDRRGAFPRVEVQQSTTIEGLLAELGRPRTRGASAGVRELKGAVRALVQR